MDLQQVVKALFEKNGELQRGFEITWRYPAKPVKNPLDAKIEKSWPTVERGKPLPLKKNAKNWFCADFKFPKDRCGIGLKGAEGWFFIYGWCPFTMWIDGEEIFRETHVWHATGPIAEPAIRTIKPGKTYRLVICFEPTEIPVGMNALGIDIKAKPAIETAVQISAAVTELKIAEALAKTSAEKRLVERAAAKVHLDALAANDFPAVLRSIGRMEAVLAPLSKRAKAMTVHIIGHTHIDMNWMWTWPDTVYCARRDFKAVTDLMDDNPDVTFTHSQVPTYEIIRKMDPGIFKKVRQHIAEGRWENAAGTWVEGDLNMADGESVARHMLYAADWTRKHLNSKAKVVWEPDTFGHPGNMPQLAKLGEFDCYFHWRCNPGREKNWPVRTWTGVDGTPITAFSTAYGSGIMPDNILWNVLDTIRFGFPFALHIWGHGDHGGGLPRFQLGLLPLWCDRPLVPTLQFSTMKQLLEHVLASKAKLPGNKGETYSLFEGCFTTHASIKKYNRACENALITAESLCTIAGLDRKNALRDGWTQTLFNHFHDIFDGAAVHDTYVDAHKMSEKALLAAVRATNEAVPLIVKPARNGRSLAVINQLGFERTEPVTAALPKGTKCLIDAAGKAIPVQPMGGELRSSQAFVFIAENVPAFSTKVYRVSKLAPKSLDLSPVKTAEEGQYLSVETNCAVSKIRKESGIIGSYFDKSLKRELIAYGVNKHLTHVPCTRTDLALNVFQVIDESANLMSAWLINDIAKEESLVRNAEVKLVEAGPVFARFSVAHKFRSSKIEEQITYYRDFGRIDFVAEIDWRERGNSEVGVPQLKVSFSSSMSAPRARFEGPFFITERPCDGTEQVTQKFLDVSGDGFGFTLYNDSKYGCDVLGGRARITLLRNPYGPDPEPDNGVHTVQFAFEPHKAGRTNAELMRGGLAFNRRPIAASTNQPAADSSSLLQIEGSNDIVCTALRTAEHSDKLVIRFFETSGKPRKARISLGKGITSAQEVNFLENPTSGKVSLAGGKAAVEFHPFEVKTLLITAKI